MYGFTEKRIAELLNFDYTPFRLNSGSEAVIIGRDEYNRLLHIIVAYWRRNGRILQRPTSINSDTEGLRIILTRYYFDIGVLEGLTDGRTKESDTYIEIMNNTGFNAEPFENFLRSCGENTTQRIEVDNTDENDDDDEDDNDSIIDYIDDNNGNDQDDETPAENVQEDVAEANEAIEANEPVEAIRATETTESNSTGNYMLHGNNSSGTYTTTATNSGSFGEIPPNTPADSENIFTPLFSQDKDKDNENNEKNPMQLVDKLVSFAAIEEVETCSNGKKIFRDYGYLNRDIGAYVSLTKDQLISLCNKLNKHIIIIRLKSALLKIEKKIDKRLLQEEAIIICVDPSQFHPRFIKNATPIKPVVFGFRLDESYITYGKDLNVLLGRIRSDHHIAEPEKQKIIEENIRSKANSPYCEYDKIFRDYVTNVPFALKDGGIIYTLSPFTLIDLHRVIIREIERRLSEDLSYEEFYQIDEEYHNKYNERNKETYVKFVSDNKNEYIEDLKSKIVEYRDNHLTYLKKAMEYGKLLHQKMEELGRFDHESYDKKIREQAQSEYEATLGLEKVAGIDIIEDSINIYTHNLYAKDTRSNRWHDIGTFHIRLGIHSGKYNTSNSVHILNTKHIIKGYADEPMQAPHVFQNGTICHGGLASGMVDAYSRRDIYQLVLQLILFLQQANTDDVAGTHINKWPEVTEDIALGKVGYVGDGIFMNEEEKEIHEKNEEFDEVFAQSIAI